VQRLDAMTSPLLQGVGPRLSKWRPSGPTARSPEEAAEVPRWRDRSSRWLDLVNEDGDRRP
jgi:hypothetical protein